MQVKLEPEDFVVDEIAEHKVSSGDWTLLRLTKRDMTTEHALKVIASHVRVPRRFVTYAGTKDKRAVTTQYVTVRCYLPALEKFSHDKIQVDVLGSVPEPLRLGDLEGNKFRIVVRDVEKEARDIVQIPNYFGEQRFSVANADIGLLLIKKEFEEAAGLVAGTDEEFGQKLDEHLEEHEHDYVGALRLLPRHTLLMYVHAYQSQLFNEALSKFIEYNDGGCERVSDTMLLPNEQLPSLPVPLVGFDSTFVEPFDGWFADLLERDGITSRDFVNKQIPFLTLEGTTRDAFIQVHDLEKSPLVDGVQTVTFSLPSGSYATVVIECLYG